MDLDGDIDMDVEGDRATVSIVGADLPQLVGDDGEVLEALQELTRLAVYRETGERSRLMLDVSGHRANRRAELEALAAEVVGRVRASGERSRSAAMSPFERKVVHDAVAAAGLTSESEGVEPRRFVVVLPAGCGPTPREPDVSRETPSVPAVARGVFSDALPLAERFARPAGDRRCGPWADRSAGGTPALGAAPGELRAAGPGGPAGASRWPTSGRAPGLPGAGARDLRGRTCTSRWSSPCCAGPRFSPRPWSSSGWPTWRWSATARRRCTGIGRSTWSRLAQSLPSTGSHGGACRWSRPVAGCWR